MDLNIIVSQNSNNIDEDLLQRNIKTAVTWGYSTVALNTIVDFKIIKKPTEIPKPIQFVEVKKDNESVRVLTRLTAIVSTEIHCHYLMHSNVVKLYDILSVQPENEKMFKYILNNMNIDIISLNLEMLPFLIKKNHIKQAANKGMHFEIEYSQLLRNRLCRVWTIAKGRNLVSNGCKKNLIVSSGAKNAMDIRQPEEVSRLCLLFGLTIQQGRDTVFTNSQKVIEHAYIRRKPGSEVISIEDVGEISESERWLLGACSFPKRFKINTL
ncbi:ribonuclease P protein subunit p30-like [Centruroides sculpturatus]|uniref:ribonuclease P protein subunit p30-like n=1 Tax=Centruroides sculpturatus TaxID=218467 RepID=UPI000C6D7461|nr:ribonuclease P protein subunit p30-like [Centruroides sculpturatus]XP_023244593.1 ribonuclease P protein subunit p30-like [Centruroides sculpturatus]